MASYTTIILNIAAPTKAVMRDARLLKVWNNLKRICHGYFLSNDHSFAWSEWTKNTDHFSSIQFGSVSILMISYPVHNNSPSGLFPPQFWARLSDKPEQHCYCGNTDRSDFCRRHLDLYTSLSNTRRLAYAYIFCVTWVHAYVVPFWSSCSFHLPLQMAAVSQNCAIWMTKM
jgi:hypothetical protein